MMATEKCDVCKKEVGPEVAEKGWPIATQSGYICPSCYGDEAHCAAEGHVLPAATDFAECPECAGS